MLKVYKMNYMWNYMLQKSQNFKLLEINLKEIQINFSNQMLNDRSGCILDEETLVQIYYPTQTINFYRCEFRSH